MNVLRRTQCQKSNQSDKDGEHRAQLDASILEKHTIELWANKHPRRNE